MNPYSVQVNHPTHRNRQGGFFQGILKQLLMVLAMLPLFLVGQENKLKIYGHLIDESNGRRLSDVLIVNKTNGYFAYGDEEGNYSIWGNKKDVFVFSALGYSSINFSLEDSISKPEYFVVLALNRYSIFIREVSVQAERKLQEITNELDKLTLNYQFDLQEEEERAGGFANPITNLYYRFSKREERKRHIDFLKYLDRKKILLKELIQKSKLNETILLNSEELTIFIEDLLKADPLLKFSSHYELLSFINQECKKWRIAKNEISEPQK